MLYGGPSDREALAWSWVEGCLTVAGTYWVVPRSPGHPHPRPVWGVWHRERLHLSVGTPTFRRAVVDDAAVTVHLDSGTDVVIVEGVVAPPATTSPTALAAYDVKYDWTYQVDQYGDLAVVEPTKVLAWRSAGPAGRDGFRSTGCWVFGGPKDDERPG
jgi:hypothetical protein